MKKNGTHEVVDADVKLTEPAMPKRKQATVDVDEKPSEPAMPKRKQATGNWNRDWEPFAKLDPAWTEKVIGVAIAPAVAGLLDQKTIELIGIALDASNLYAPGVRRHIRRALQFGATREQITAVLQLTSMQGLRSMCVGAPILIEELDATERRTA